jgi:CHAT domain-containing protein
LPGRESVAQHGRVPSRSHAPVQLVLILVCSIAIADTPPSARLFSVPGMSRELARHLLSDSDLELARYAHRVGNMDLRAGISSLDRAPDPTSPERYARSFAAIRPYWGRLAGVLEREFGLPCYLRELIHRDSLSAREGMELQRATAKVESLASAHGLRPEVIRDSLLAIQAWCDVHGHRRLAMFADNAIFDWAIVQGDEASELRHARACVVRALRLGDYLMACQALGWLPIFSVDSWSDSLTAPRDLALRIAREHELIDQVARLLEFRSNRERSEGHLVAARMSLNEARDAWRPVEGRGQEIRAVFALVEFYSKLDCWDASDGLLEQTGPRLRHLRAEQRTGEAQRCAREILWHRARSLLAAGEADSALSVLGEFDFQGVRGADRLTLAAHIDVLTLAMVEAGRASEALPLLEAGIAHCESTHAVPEGLPLHLRRARVLAAFGRPQAAVQELRWLENLEPTPMLEDADRIGIRALHARLLLDQARPALAKSQLDTALAILWRRAHQTDAGAEGYLLLADPPDLREAMQAFAGRDAAASYRLEMALQSWVGPLGGAARGELEPRWLWPRESDAPRLVAGEAHVVFAFADHRLVRWTATPREVALDTLPGDRAAWHRRIRRVRDLLAISRPDTALARERSRLLRELGELLPSGLRVPGSLKRLYVTANGPLAALPFEAIDIGRGAAYEPFGMRVEVAVARAVRSGGTPATDVAVLADPTVPPDYLRRYPGLVGLADSRAEADVVQSLWPHARVRMGDDARKGNVLSDWNHSGVIHVAAHLVRVPEIPYYDFIPIAPERPAREGARDAVLEVADIRSLDLSRCELVVLSTCASGVPYVAHHRVGPSMADAFLDAGARAVLRTMRPLGDAEGRPFVAAFLRAWRTNGHDAVAAAQAARLESLPAGPSGADPYAWSAWSVAVNLVPGALRSSPVLASTARRGGELAPVR